MDFLQQLYTENITFLSGYNSALLNIFVKEGLDTLRETTPLKSIRTYFK